MMTPDEAINRLQARVDGEFSIKGVDRCEDIRLGIEAIRVYIKSQAAGWYPPGYKLPGETEE
jgi:hypothetical protein